MRNRAVKKALSLILALCLTLTLAPFTASAEETSLGTSGEIVDSGDLPISDETPASPADLAKSLPQGGMMPQAIDPDHAFVVDGNSYATLGAALGALPSGGGTITVQRDVTYTDPVVINSFDVTFQLDKSLTINPAVGTALTVENGSVTLTGSGTLNVKGQIYGVHAKSNAIVTVHNSESTAGTAAYAENGGVITVEGDAAGYAQGAYAKGSGSEVTVTGDATGTYAGAVNAEAGGYVKAASAIATAASSYGVRAIGESSNLSTVEITGDVTGAGHGVHATNYANITVGGDVTVTDTSGTAVFAGANSTVTIDGSITTTGTYIHVGGSTKTAADKTDPTTLTGYDTYSAGTSTVWVKATSAPTPLATPTGLAWDTATEGVIKAKWDAVTGAQGYTIMLYKDGAPVGPLGTMGATSLQLTTYIQNSGTGSFTFTVRALAPSGSTEYTDSANSLPSPAHSYTAPAAIPAEGSAWATLYTKSIFVTLSQGGFKAVQDKAYWLLGGDGASGNPIVGVTYISNTEVQITLTNDINSLDALTITADQNAFATGTTPFASQLAVRLDSPSTYVCTIDGVAYTSLKSALAFALAPTVDNKTIVLAADIRYEEPVVVEGKTLTIYLNGKNLVIDTSETVTDDWFTASALKVDNGSISYMGEGKFTVCGERCGVEAIKGGMARVSEILVKNPGRPYPDHYYVYGAYAQNNNSEGEGSQITVTGGIRTLSGRPCDYVIGALAGQDATVTVGGDIFLEGENVIGLSAGSRNHSNGTATAQNITVTGESAVGVSATGVSTATVNGAVTATGAYARGAEATTDAEDNSGGTVIVKGDAVAAGANSTGVTCLSGEHNSAKSLVIVDGAISGENYLKIDNAVRAKDTKDSVTGGYWIYNGQYESVVRVKDPDGGTPGGNVPSAPENLTAAPSNGQVALSWTAPADNGDSAITGYQVSKDGGVSWTNVGLTTAYTFTNLTNGTEYTFKVRAVNSAGSGAEASRTATPTSAPSVPTVPRNFTASPGFERVILNWDAPTSNGGSSILRYEVSQNNGADWTSAGLYTSYEFTGLTNGTEYTFKVRAVNSAGNGAEASASAVPSDSAQTSFTVSFYTGGALYTSRSVMNGSALGGSWPTDPTRSGYTFGGWFTGQNGAGVRYTSASVITADVDLYANWSCNGGSGNGGGSDIPEPPITTEKQPDMPTTAKQSVPGTGENGVLSATITEQMVGEAIKAAQDAAQKSGEEADGIALDFDVTGNGSYTSLNATIDAAAIDRLKEAGVRFIKIGSSILDVTLDTAAIAEVDRQSSGVVTISAVRQTKLSDAAKALIGNRPVFGITVGHQRNGKPEYVTDFGQGAVILGIAYEAQGNERAEDLYGVYIDNNGRPQLLPGSSYDNGRLMFSRNSLSAYGVGYKTPAPAFTDTEKHWAKDNIDVVAGRGLIVGTTLATFGPNTAITRADFLMALGRLSGADVSMFKNGSFTDVKSDDSAMPYIEWAVTNKIVQGIGDGKFGPALSITRQDMAVMMQNYAKATGYTLPVSTQAVTFTDSEKIAAYAAEAVKAIGQAGIMRGKGGNTFDPQGNATRAEAATILCRFVELVIDEGTARGWVQNEAGGWQYIGENGKPVTGWLTSTGTDIQYYFDDNGIMVSGKWLQISGKWYYFYPDGALAKSTNADGYEVDANGVRKSK